MQRELFGLVRGCSQADHHSSIVLCHCGRGYWRGESMVWEAGQGVLTACAGVWDEVCLSHLSHLVLVLSSELQILGEVDPVLVEDLRNVAVPRR